MSDDKTEKLDDCLMGLIDATDAKRSSRAVHAKRYSIDKLRAEGVSDEVIERLLNVRL
jgi:hypothetical protein